MPTVSAIKSVLIDTYGVPGGMLELSTHFKRFVKAYESHLPFGADGTRVALPILSDRLVIWTVDGTGHDVLLCSPEFEGPTQDSLRPGCGGLLAASAPPIATPYLSPGAKKSTKINIRAALATEGCHFYEVDIRCCGPTLMSAVLHSWCARLNTGEHFEILTLLANTDLLGLRTKLYDSSKLKQSTVKEALNKQAQGVLSTDCDIEIAEGVQLYQAMQKLLAWVTDGGAGTAELRDDYVLHSSWLKAFRAGISEFCAASEYKRDGTKRTIPQRLHCLKLFMTGYPIQKMVTALEAHLVDDAMDFGMIGSDALVFAATTKQTPEQLEQIRNVAEDALRAAIEECRAIQLTEVALCGIVGIDSETGDVRQGEGEGDTEKITYALKVGPACPGSALPKDRIEVTAEEQPPVLSGTTYTGTECEQQGKQQSYKPMIVSDESDSEDSTGAAMAGFRPVKARHTIIASDDDGSGTDQSEDSGHNRNYMNGFVCDAAEVEGAYDSEEEEEGEFDYDVDGDNWDDFLVDDADEVHEVDDVDPNENPDSLLELQQSLQSTQTAGFITDFRPLDITSFVQALFANVMRILDTTTQELVEMDKKVKNRVLKETVWPLLFHQWLKHGFVWLRKLHDAYRFESVPLAIDTFKTDNFCKIEFVTKNPVCVHSAFTACKAFTIPSGATSATPATPITMKDAIESLWRATQNGGVMPRTAKDEELMLPYESKAKIFGWLREATYVDGSIYKVGPCDDYDWPHSGRKMPPHCLGLGSTLIGRSHLKFMNYAKQRDFSKLFTTVKLNPDGTTPITNTKPPDESAIVFGQSAGEDSFHIPGGSHRDSEYRGILDPHLLDAVEADMQELIYRASLIPVKTEDEAVRIESMYAIVRLLWRFARPAFRLIVTQVVNIMVSDGSVLNLVIEREDEINQDHFPEECVVYICFVLGLMSKIAIPPAGNRQPMLFLVVGVPGSSKSTFTDFMTKAFGGIKVPNNSTAIRENEYMYSYIKEYGKGNAHMPPFKMQPDAFTQTTGLAHSDALPELGESADQNGEMEIVANKKHEEVLCRKIQPSNWVRCANAIPTDLLSGEKIDSQNRSAVNPGSRRFDLIMIPVKVKDKQEKQITLTQFTNAVANPTILDAIDSRDTTWVKTDLDERECIFSTVVLAALCENLDGTDNFVTNKWKGSEPYSQMESEVGALNSTRLEDVLTALKQIFAQKADALGFDTEAMLNEKDKSVQLHGHDKIRQTIAFKENKLGQLATQVQTVAKSGGLRGATAVNADILRGILVPERQSRKVMCTACGLCLHGLNNDDLWQYVKDNDLGLCPEAENGGGHDFHRPAVKMLQ